MHEDTQSLPPREDFIAWLAEHATEVVGLANHLMYAGPVANWLRSLGYYEVVVTREQIMGRNMTEFVNFGAPNVEWQLVLAAEDSFNSGIEGDSGEEIRGEELLDRLDDFWYN